MQRHSCPGYTVTINQGTLKIFPCCGQQFRLPSLPLWSTASGLPWGKAVAYSRVCRRNKEAPWPPFSNLKSL